MTRFVLSLLHRIGTPTWTIYIFSALYANVVAFPILKNKHDVTIGMENGLRQGCPLSPLLFNLSIDPLLTNLSRIQDVQTSFL